MRRWRAATERGFTLIELLVVLAILSLVLAVLLPNLGASRETVELRAAATEMRAILRAARSTAIAANHDLVFAIDASGRGYLLDGAVHGFRSGGFTSRSLHVEPATPITFFATGGTSGGRLAIRGARSEQALQIDSLTGQVALAP
jgi:prepilin-type N-terminal cleavage/methylation domain-containing protein